MTLLQYLTPINIRTERAKFLSSDTYSPVFEYKWEAENVGKLYETRKSDLKRAILSQDHSAITNAAQIYFDTQIDEETLKIAEDCTKKTPAFVNEDIDNLKESFERALKFFSLDYKVILTKAEGFNIRPNTRNKEILISKNAKLDFFTADSEIKHEMTHILRYENGEFNKRKRDSNYLPTEEGLACHFHDNKTEIYQGSRFQHAAEYIASRIGITQSLRNIYDYFISIGFSNELAWQRSIRHKFGFKDTSKPGDIIKPVMYFHHSQEIAKLSENELWRLFVGKISTAKLAEHPLYTGKYPIEQIKEFYNSTF